MNLNNIFSRGYEKSCCFYINDRSIGLKKAEAAPKSSPNKIIKTN